MKNYGNRENKNKLDNNSAQDHYNHSYNPYRNWSRKRIVTYVDKETGEELTLKQAKNEYRTTIRVSQDDRTTTIELGPARVQQLKLEF